MGFPSLRGALATKQSMSQRKEKLDCFASLAMTFQQLSPVGALWMSAMLP
jgi:hypothetical protein